MGDDGKHISTLVKREAERLMKSQVIEGGMLPKVESALRALAGGAQKAHIIDGRVPHAILLEVLTKEGIGTEIVLSQETPGGHQADDRALGRPDHDLHQAAAG